MQTNSKLEQQVSLLQMLSALLDIGFPISTALEIMEAKFAVSHWQEQLEQGQSLYQVFANDQFDRDVLLILKVGLDSEDLKTTINKSIQILLSKIEKREEMIELIKYPIMLLVIATLSIGFVTLFLLPQFEKILGSMGATSAATTMLYSIFGYGPYVLVALIVIIAISAIVIARLSTDNRLKLLIKFKPVRKIYVSLYNQIFAVTLSNLLKTDLHLSLIITVLSQQTENSLLANEAKLIEQGLKQGKYISDCITPVYYDVQFLQIIRLGEESGMLIYYLDSYSKVISAINRNRGQKIIFWIQPLFYMIFGILILLMYAAIFIPMFALMDSI